MRGARDRWARAGVFGLGCERTVIRAGQVAPLRRNWVTGLWRYGEASGAVGGQIFALSEGSLSFDRFCFEIGHITLCHGKPQDDLPADF